MSDLHPRWADGSPILFGEDVVHATERWQGFVAGIPSSDELTVCWWTDEGDFTDGEEYSPDALWLSRGSVTSSTEETTMSEPMTDDGVGFGLPDPPYVAGDHYTTCRGCDHCAELEDRYFADQDARKRLGDDE